ncbi:MAG: EAL domain-containing protein, partial [Mesorhizobium sp.]
RYSAVEGALASGFAIADLHHAVGHDHPRQNIPKWDNPKRGLVAEPVFT